MTMKKNIFSKLLFSGLLTCLIFALAGCASNDLPSPVDIPNEFVNQQILLRVSPYGNTYKTTDTVTLELKYVSTNVIIFPRNFNLKIFEYIDDQWVTINEKPTERVPQEDIVLAPYKEIPVVTAVSLYPDILDIWKSHKLRIYVVGEMQTDAGVQDVAAYTEIILNP
jgi:hypothetical protein